MQNFILPNWTVPTSIRGLTTTRLGGLSSAPYDSFNLGAHVGDNIEAVLQNRGLLCDVAHLPNPPLYLNQTHSHLVATIRHGQLSSQHADAVYTNELNQVCSVLTADCLPVLFASKDGKEVAAAHAGWRGLASGILENTLGYFDNSPEHIIAWLGPAIGPNAFEVGEDVYHAFVEKNDKAHQAFVPIPRNNGPQKYLADIYQLAKLALNAAGVMTISGGDYCTVTDNHTFYSYRKEGQTGRMLSAVWIANA